MAHQLFEAPPEQRLRMSYDEFLAAFPETVQAEWVDGEAIILIPPTTIHQRVVGVLYNLLSFYAHTLKLGLVFASPIQMRALPDSSAREPDIVYVANEHRDWITRQRLVGPADLVVEVVSDESTTHDRVDKFFEYQDAGVREYWIIDPRSGKERVDCYWLDADNQYQPTPPDADNRYHAHVLPGFWFRAAWLWQESPPDPLTALAEMRSVPSATLQALRNALSTTAALMLVSVLVAVCNDCAALALGAVGASVTSVTPALGPVAAPTLAPTAPAALPGPSRGSTPRLPFAAPFLTVSVGGRQARHGQKGMR